MNTFYGAITSRSCNQSPAVCKNVCPHPHKVVNLFVERHDHDFKGLYRVWRELFLLIKDPGEAAMKTWKSMRIQIFMILLNHYSLMPYYPPLYVIPAPPPYHTIIPNIPIPNSRHKTHHLTPYTNPPNQMHPNPHPFSPIQPLSNPERPTFPIPMPRE